MKGVSMWMAAAVAAAGLLAGPAAAQTPEQLIADAVRPLPDDLKAGATVVQYDRKTGARNVLRQGTNFVECQPKMADGFVRCYNKAFGPRRDLEARLTAEGKSEKDISAAVDAAVKAGTIPQAPAGSMSYRLYDGTDRIQNLWVFSIPGGTPKSVGVSAASQRDSAIGGSGLPWMMLPGTPGAHVMIPINPKPAKSTITDVAADEVAQATLPLPEDLRAGATVYKYDPATGDRIVLRKGTNGLECQPRGEDGFTWCYNEVTAARRDMTAKLRAQKKTDKEIEVAMADAAKAGTVKPTPFGTMSYRLYGKNDRIQLLYVFSVPNATPESVGVSTVSQRDDAIDHDGRPWLMLAGTPGAHIMVPINK